MSLNKPLIALSSIALAAIFGYAVAQDAPAAGSPQVTTSTTTEDVQNVTVPGSRNGVVESNRPPGTYTASPGSVENNNVMTTGVNTGSTRVSVGDHATPAQPDKAAVTTMTSRTTTTTTTTAPQAEATPMQPAAQAEPEAAPMEPEFAPEPRSARN